MHDAVLPHTSFNRFSHRGRWWNQNYTQADQYNYLILLIAYSRSFCFIFMCETLFMSPLMIHYNMLYFKPKIIKMKLTQFLEQNKSSAFLKQVLLQKKKKCVRTLWSFFCAFILVQTNHMGIAVTCSFWLFCYASVFSSSC